jgi:hypothetical protein
MSRERKFNSFKYLSHVFLPINPNVKIPNNYEEGINELFSNYDKIQVNFCKIYPLSETRLYPCKLVEIITMEFKKRKDFEKYLTSLELKHSTFSIEMTIYAFKNYNNNIINILPEVYFYNLTSILKNDEDED